MGQMITELFQAFTTMIPALANGIKDGFSQLLWQDPDATTKVLSDPVQFILLFGGVAIGFGIFYKVFGMIRRRG